MAGPGPCSKGSQEGQSVPSRRTSKESEGRPRPSPLPPQPHPRDLWDLSTCSRKPTGPRSLTAVCWG